MSITPNPTYPPGPSGPSSGVPQQSIAPLAIVGLVLAFLVPLVGAIVSLVALGQTGPTKRGGRGLAIAGTIIGFVLTIVTIAVIVGSVLAARAATDAAGDSLQEIAEGFETAYQDKAAVDAGTVEDFSGDFVIGEVTPGDFASTIEVEITNNSDLTYTYTATVSVVSTDGSGVLDSAYVLAESLAPGETSVQVGQFSAEIPEDAEFELTDYTRSSF